MSEENKKSLIMSGSFWALIAASVWGIDWEVWIPQAGAMLEGVVPPEWIPIVKAGVALLIALIGIVRVYQRKQQIGGVFRAPKPKLPEPSDG